MDHLLVEFFVYLVILPLGYLIGFVPVMVFSLFTVLPGPLGKLDDRDWYRSQGMKWWHLTYEKDGTRYLPAEAVGIVGFCILGLMFGCCWILAKLITGQ